MSFFKDFKADFAQAVNELIPDSEEMTTEFDDDEMVNTLEEKSAEDIDIAPEDLIDAIEEHDIQDNASPSIPAEGTDTQMSFDFLSNALGVTDSGQEADSPSISEAMQADKGAGPAGADAQQEIDFAKNFAAALNTNAADMAAQIPEPVQATAPAPEPVQAAAPTPEPVAAPAPEPVAAPAPESVQAAAPTPEPVAAPVQAPVEAAAPEPVSVATAAPAPMPEPQPEAAQQEAVPDNIAVDTQMNNEALEEAADKEEPLSKQSDTLNTEENAKNQKEEQTMINAAGVGDSTEEIAENDGTTTYITKNTKITGDIETEGSIDIIGSVIGNVTCKGKLVVGGIIQGNANANEIYANSARIEGDVICDGSAKIGVGSVIIGKVEGASAVIAGAVNGDIDVHGPVIVDSTAVIMGNIKSKSVQINNGAVIEGFCSQSYSDIDVKSFFA